MAKFRKKPVVTEAFQWTGWAAKDLWPCWFHQLIANRAIRVIEPYAVGILTLEGHRMALKGEWIIRDADGKLSVCAYDAFIQTYEPVDEEQDEAIIEKARQLAEHAPQTLRAAIAKAEAARDA